MAKRSPKLPEAHTINFGGYTRGKRLLLLGEVWRYAVMLERGNMTQAYEQVVGNKGSHGIDNMEADQLKPYLQANWEGIKRNC